MEKTIVTHMRPDLDCCSAVWLVKRYIPGFRQAQIMFVVAGSTFNGQPADTDDNVIHVDTGFGKFDHHQDKTRTSAARKLYLYLNRKDMLVQKDKKTIKRLTDLVNQIDNFEEVDWPDPNADIYELGLHQILQGIRYQTSDDYQVLDFCLEALDGLYGILKMKTKAEKELQKAKEIRTKSNITALVIESTIDETISIAQKNGSILVIRRDPNSGRVRIKARPNSGIDLTKTYQAIIKKDSPSNWFLHATGKMLLNGSSKKPDNYPTKLSLKEIVTIVKANN